MGDSDDEYDRRRVRDKFRGERSEYEQRRPRGDYRDRRDWGDRRGRDSWSGGRDQGWDRKRGGQYYGRPRRDSEGGDGQMSPPIKRNRRDWDSSYDKGFNSGGMAPSAGMWSGGRGPLMQHQGGEPGKQGITEMSGDVKNQQTPKMMTFKSFLIAQEENIDEMEAVRRYQEYKTEFKRTQLSDFFVLHKDEEWFKNKYHPVDSKIQAKERRQAVKKRLQIFLDVLESGQLDNITLEGSCSDAVTKLLDSVAIRLEGGTADDLAVLDDKKTSAEENKSLLTEEQRPEEEGKLKEVKIEPDVEQSLSPSSVPLPAAPPPGSQSKEKEGAKEKKRKGSNEHSYDGEGEINSESSESETENEPAPPGEDFVGTDHDASGKDKNAVEEKQAETTESSQPEEDGETDPGPPGVDKELDNSKEPKKSEEQGGVSEDSGNESERKQEEKNKGLVAHLTQTKSENTKQEEEAKQKKSDSEGEKDKGKGKEEKKSGKRDWERRKGTGLGAFVAKMGGEGNEDSDSDSESDSDEDEEEIGEKSEEKEPVKTRSERVEEKKFEPADAEEGKQTDAETRQLHKTLSLFMRSVPPNISKADIAAVCKRYPGYLRVALADPSPERSFYRRGWVTFENNVNIKDVCWNLSNIRIKDCELIPVVNRDLSKRIRPIAGITLCQQVVRFDLKFSVKLIKALDEKIALYSKEADEEENVQNSMDIEEQEMDENGEGKEEGEEVSEATAKPIVETEVKVDERPLPDENPLLGNLPIPVTEEQRDLAEDNGTGTKEKELDFTRDDNLVKALDRLLLYLRIVHSVDYYNGSDYPYEDEMPNRCGILHVRGEIPEKALQLEVAEWKTNVEQKLGHYLEKVEERLADEEVQKLGKKNVDEEVETFINANTQELAQDKWLCPLSGKKFRAKEFVMKHIHNKHSDKLEAVRLEAGFFNNYLADPKRPHFPESSPAKSSGSTTAGQYGHQQQPSGPQMGWNPRGPMMMYGGPRAPFTPPSYGGAFAGGPDVYGRGGGTYPPKVSRNVAPLRDSRKVVHYKDLDAPDDMDFF